MRLALYQPDIPQNTASLMRLCACLGVGLDIVEPCGFTLDDRSLRRVGMDYVRQAEVVRHADFDALRAAGGRIVLLSTKAALPYTRFSFSPGDTLLLGRESAGVPQAVHEACDARVLVPMRSEARALNVALAAALVLGEALRQTNGFVSAEMEGVSTKTCIAPRTPDDTTKDAP